MHNKHEKICMVKDTDPKKAVNTVLDNLKGLEKRVSAHSHILIKPNLGGGVAGEPGSHTSIGVVRAVLEAFSSFSLPVYIGEADGSFNSADHMFSTLGIHELGKHFNARVVNLSRGPSVDCAVPRPNRITSLRISTVFQHAFIVSLPVLKTHPWCAVTVSMKNMYGGVYQREKAVLHTGLEENIVDINKVIGAHLSIVDATTAVVHGGFKYALWVGCPPSKLDLVFAGYDFVAVDAVGTRILDRNPDDIDYIRLAARHGLGTCNLEEMDITGNGFPVKLLGKQGGGKISNKYFD